MTSLHVDLKEAANVLILYHSHCLPPISHLRTLVQIQNGDGICPNL